MSLSDLPDLLANPVKTVILSAMNKPEMGRLRSLTQLTDDESPLSWGCTLHSRVGEELYDMHYEWEMGIVLEGSMERIWENHKTSCSAGDVWFTGVWEPHGFRVLKAPCRVAVFLIRPEFLSRISLGFPKTSDLKAPFLSSPHLRPVVPKDSRDVFIQWGLTLETDSAQNNSGGRKGLSPYSLSQLSLLTFLKCLTVVMDRWAPPKSQKEVENPQTIKPAVDMVLSTTLPVSENQAAEACAMSLSTFERRFKAAMGVSFGRFAQNYRLKGAAERLKNSDESIKSIASSFGFQDLSHFYRSFKKAFHKTPAEYRG